MGHPPRREAVEDGIQLPDQPGQVTLFNLKMKLLPVPMPDKFRLGFKVPLGGRPEIPVQLRLHRAKTD
ncbi:hypothetical protein GCM10017782_06720 [Deinococcus ficus]|nr:hypothetical protein GCM10017782_06720 [Deinococcus ficus]